MTQPWTTPSTTAPATRLLFLSRPPSYVPRATVTLGKMNHNEEQDHLDALFKQKRALRSRVRKALKAMDPALRSQEGTCFTNLIAVHFSVTAGTRTDPIHLGACCFVFRQWHSENCFEVSVVSVQYGIVCLYKLQCFARSWHVQVVVRNSAKSCQRCVLCLGPFNLKKF